MVLAELVTGKAEIPSGDETVFLQPDGDAILPIILRCLASDPKDRYPSVQVLRYELEIIRDVLLFSKNMSFR